MRATIRPLVAGHAVLVLTLSAFVLRLVSGFNSAVISRDGISYLEVAGRFARGEFAAGFAHHYPPAYPLWLALAGLWRGGPSEATAIVASALAGALLVPAAILLSRRAYGERAGLYAGLCAACCPLLVELGGQVLSESLYLPLVLWTLVLFQAVVEARPRANLAAACAGALGLVAYLTRPEGLAVLAIGGLGVLALPRPASWRRRALNGLSVFALLLIGLVPFLLYLKGKGTIAGSGAGLLKLTSKQDMPDLLARVSLGSWLAIALDVLRQWLKALGPGLVLLAGAAWGAPRPRPPGGSAPGRRLAWLCAGTGALLLLVFGTVRSDRRYAAQLVALSLPILGLGGAVLSETLRQRWARAPLAIALALALLWVPLAQLPAHRRKVSYRQAGSLLAAAGARRVLAFDSRAAFYAGCEPVELWAVIPRGHPISGEEVVAVARREHADAVVLRVDSPLGKKVSAELRELLGVDPTPVRGPRQVSLDLFAIP